MISLSNARNVGLGAFLVTILHWILARFSALFWKTDTTPAEILSGMSALGWGIVLFLSPTFEARNLYDYMNSVAAQGFWSGLTMTVGFCQLFMAFTCPQDAHPQIRTALWLCAGIFWLYVFFISVLAIPVTTVAATSGTLLVASAWAFYRVSNR